MAEATAEIKRLRSKLAELEAAATATTVSSEPIAIIGMGCRFPGDANTPEAFWELLATGRDVLRDIPSTRWDVDAFYDPEISLPGKMYVRQGHYLDDIDQFDPQFFGLSPREAESLDPQQRLVMEVSWETLENAGIAASSLKGGKTGVFVGQYWDDYSMQRIYATDLREIDRYAQLSGLRGLTAGRICHILDSHGPAMQVDTACSSSSLAVHLACQSLTRGECDLALAGGVSLILAPEHLIGICQMKALSADGRCKTFDEDADGFGQGEGCGMIALKRLADAQADGDAILAVIQGSAVNHDGQARTVTTPSGPAQRAMLQDALVNAGLNPHQLDYLETHGTGTPLGDPIEVMAIARILCQNRTKPLYLGSVKTNIGHLDAAAGIAGIMKCVLALQHEVIPPHLNFNKPNPRIPWNDWPLQVPTEQIPWGSKSNIRFAGISAFGMSGTNVHLIVGQAPDTVPIITDRQSLYPQQILTLSAQSSSILPDVARTYADFLTHLSADEPSSQVEITNVCYTAATGRSHFAHRIAIVGESATAMQKELADFANGQTPARTLTGATGRRPPKLAFLFTGQGAQHVGMGQSLYSIHPTFRYWLDRCADHLYQQLDKPLLDVLWSGEDLHQTAYTQPALFAVEFALAKLWQEWGVEPDLLLGHSIGEYAAACLAGVFSLEDGLNLVAARGRLMQSLPPGGEMVSVAADEDTVSEIIIHYPAELSVAAVNGPQSIVISGASNAVQSAVALLRDRNIKTTQLKVSHAFHSPLMEPILDEFRAIAAQVTYSTPTKPVLSNVTGQEYSDDLLTPDYWVQHLRGAVRFADGILAAQQRKIETFVEVGPRPTLIGLGQGCVTPNYGTWLASLKPKAEWPTLLSSVAELHVRGVEVDWAAFHRHSRQKVMLPNYPWRRQRCWTDVVSAAPAGSQLHPLVHRKIATASTSIIFESRLSVSNPAYLGDHLVFDSVVFPASAFVEMALAAGQFALGSTDLSIANLSILKAMLLAETSLTVQIIITPDEDKHRFEIFSSADEPNANGNGDWFSHAVGHIERRQTPIMQVQEEPLKAGDIEVIDLDTFDNRFKSRGVEYGPAFQAIAEIGRPAGATETILAQIELPKEALAAGESNAYSLHPVLLDASFRVAEALFSEGEKEEIYLPFTIGKIRCAEVPIGSLSVRATGVERERTRSVNLDVFDQDGKCVATIEEFLLRSVSVFGLQRETASSRVTDILTEGLYQLHWQQKPSNDERVADNLSGTWLILADACNLGLQLAAKLEQQGASCCIVSAANNFQQLSDNHHQINPEVRADFDQLVTEILPESLAGVVHLWSLGAEEQDYKSGLAGALHIVQSLQHAGKAAPTWLVTRGAQAVAVKDMARLSLWQTPLWGFGRTLQVEHPEFRGICIDLDDDNDDLELLLAEIKLGRDDVETQIAYRSTERYVARLNHAHLQDTAKVDFLLNADAAYLITGGLGALGFKIAQFLVTSGARHLLLTGRSGIASSEQQAAVSELEKAGVRVQIVAADISKAQDVQKVLQLAGPTLRGIIHAAGVLDDGMITQQTMERFRSVAVPKVNGAWHLHSQTLEHSLDFFVLFSSVASVLGSAGQANYAAANAFMDGLAHFRNLQGLPALSVNWGPWADVGMASSDAVMRRLMNDGWHPMTSEQGYRALKHLLSRGMSQAAVIPLDWSVFAQQVPSASEWSVLADLMETAGTSGEITASAAQLLAEQAKASEPEQRLNRLTTYLFERIAGTLRVPVTDLGDQVALTTLGMDSLTAVELRSWIHNDLDVELPVEQMFTTPTIRDLASAINSELADDGTGHTKTAVVASNGLSASTWIMRPQPRPEARLRLFCFPFAGGGASMYRDWSETFPTDVELCLVQLPGREERLQELPLTEMSTLVPLLTQAITDHTDKPFAFLGHSMGAVIAFEVARHLRTLGETQVVHLFLSARAAPQLPNDDGNLRLLSDDEFMEKLHHLYGAVPEAIRGNTQLREIFLPILKADVTLLETHTFVPSDPLDCPITVFGGEQDPHISKPMLSAWREQTRATFTQRQFPGDHFYIMRAKDTVTRTIVEQLL